MSRNGHIIEAQSLWKGVLQVKLTGFASFFGKSMVTKGNCLLDLSIQNNILISYCFYLLFQTNPIFLPKLRLNSSIPFTNFLSLHLSIALLLEFCLNGFFHFAGFLSLNLAALIITYCLNKPIFFTSFFSLNLGTTIMFCINR